MMSNSNGDLPAHPDKWDSMMNGLTKREHYAGLAMQGLLTCTMDTDCSIPELCKDAVVAADALLKELEK